MERLIVIAAIIERDGRILLAQRKPGGKLALKWEFPGGKLEWGEDPEAGIQREILEELGMEITPGPVYAVHSVVERERHLLLIYYMAAPCGSSIPQPLDCNDYCWVHPLGLLAFDLAPTDRKVAEKLCADFNNSAQLQVLNPES